jgi:hypothetical protein
MGSLAVVSTSQATVVGLVSFENRDHPAAHAKTPFLQLRSQLTFYAMSLILIRQ